VDTVNYASLTDTLIHFLSTLVPPGGGWSQRYTYVSTYADPTLVVRIPSVDEGRRLLASDVQIYIRGKGLIVKTDKPAENLTLIVHDVMGREIERVEINGKFEERTYLKVSKGVYFYRLLQDNRTVTKGKIVLVD